MGYFSNGTEGMIYEEEYCSNCVHNNRCAVLDAHFLHNYKECNNEESILHILIPRSENGLSNGECKMFYKKQKDAIRNSSKEPTYPCIKCGKLRTKAEGGTTFTVCDKCWDAGKQDKGEG